jgi:hypothetical protein
MTTIADVLRLSGVEYRSEGHHHCRPGWLQLNCPYCGEGSDGFHLGYNLHYNYVNCWRCGKHSVADVLSRLTGMSWAESKKVLGSLDSKSIPKIDRPTGKLVLPKGLGPLQKPHRKYLEGRGFDIPYLENVWNLQGIGVGYELQWRIFIPIYLRDKVVSWTTRSIRDSGLRYRSASALQEAIPHKSLLYGEQYCRHVIIIVEGPVDVWTIGPGAVGTCGIGYSMKQLTRMSKYAVRVICFDNEPVAQKRARELCSLLEPYPGETYNVTLDGKDANTASSKDIRKLRKAFLK